MTNKPLVSILINNYNYGKFLAEAIDSALAQTYPYCETIVVDDGSIDNSREIISSYGESIIPILKENGGQASAFNTGFAASQGEIICLLDADDLFLPDKVESIVAALQTHPDSHWFYHTLDYQDDTSINRQKAKGKMQESQNKRVGDLNLPPTPTTNSCEVWDLRSSLQNNRLRVKFPQIIPATSGICFTYSLLDKILPMPEGQGIALNENYLKFLALALEPGLTIDHALAVQRIHSNNAFTLKQNQDLMANKINLINAYWIRTNFPHLSGYANKLFASGLGQSQHFSQEKYYLDTNPIELASRQVVEKYFSLTSPLEKAAICLKSLFYYLKP
jgi:glycosyltransferase involved in cell wall biosynthesis